MSVARTTQNLRELELKVPPLLLLALFVAAMYGLSRAAPALTLTLPGRTVVASLLAGIGAGIGLAGVVAFRRRKTTVDPRSPGDSSAVVSTGVYRLSRNPMYVGFLLVLAGWAVYLSSAPATLLLPAYVGYMNRFQIRPEERILAGKFGPAFTDYMAAVRRWL